MAGGRQVANSAGELSMRRWTLSIETLSCLVLGVSAISALGAVAVVEEAWEDCAIDRGGLGAGALDLVLHLPLLWLGEALLVGLVLGLSTRLSSRFSVRLPVAAVSSLFVLIVVSWSYIVLVGLPGSPYCPDGIPPWWPSWIPA